MFINYNKELDCFWFDSRYKVVANEQTLCSFDGANKRYHSVMFDGVPRETYHVMGYGIYKRQTLWTFHLPIDFSMDKQWLPVDMKAKDFDE